MEYKFKATPMTRRPLSTEKIMIRLGLGLFVVYIYGLYNAYKMSVDIAINVATPIAYKDVYGGTVNTRIIHVI